ncbi:MAG: carboxypeptidase-like regulatory domain-containing protein [Microscillaceae bacterium]|nr:carboxypeptidase-like regulatory domain-containing protein [Microscillaceae bacterium]
MKTNFRLNINKPCSEKFSEFQSTDTGGFCLTCQKEVIDFTEMNEHEIIQYFKNNQQHKTCGYLRTSQLKTYLEIIPSKRKQHYQLFGLGLISFSLVSLFSISNSQAQAPQKSTAVLTHQNISNKVQNTNSEADKDEHIVEGVVVDEENNPVPGVAIVLKNSNTGTQTDIDGKFKFPIPLKSGDILIFSSVGFETKKFVVEENTSNTINITLKIYYCVLMGEVVADGAYSSKVSFWQKLKRVFR